MENIQTKTFDMHKGAPPPPTERTANTTRKWGELRAHEHELSSVVATGESAQPHRHYGLHRPRDEKVGRRVQHFRVVLPDDAAAQQAPATDAGNQSGKDDNSISSTSSTSGGGGSSSSSSAPGERDSNCVILRSKPLLIHCVLAKKAPSVPVALGSATGFDILKKNGANSEERAERDDLLLTDDFSLVGDDACASPDGILTGIPSVSLRKAGYASASTAAEMAQLAVRMINNMGPAAVGHEGSVDDDGDLGFAVRDEKRGGDASISGPKHECRHATFKLGLSTVTLDPPPPGAPQVPRRQHSGVYGRSSAPHDQQVRVATDRSGSEQSSARLTTSFITDLDECGYDAECRIEHLLKSGTLVELTERSTARLVAQVQRSLPRLPIETHRVEMHLHGPLAEDGGIECRTDIRRPILDVICPRLPVDCRWMLDVSRQSDSSDWAEMATVAAAAYRAWVTSQLPTRPFTVAIPPCWSPTTAAAGSGAGMTLGRADCVEVVPKYIRRYCDRVFAVQPTGAGSEIEITLSRVNQLELLTKPGGRSLTRRQYRHPLLMKEHAARKGYSLEMTATSGALRRLMFEYLTEHGETANDKRAAVGAALAKEWLRALTCVNKLLNDTDAAAPALIRRLGRVVPTPPNLRVGVATLASAAAVARAKQQDE